MLYEDSFSPNKKTPSDKNNVLKRSHLSSPKFVGPQQVNNSEKRLSRLPRQASLGFGAIHNQHRHEITPNPTLERQATMSLSPERTNQNRAMVRQAKTIERTGSRLARMGATVMHSHQN